jgi:hypothetical protein
MPPDAREAAYRTVYSNEVRRLRSAVEALVRRSWRTLPDYRDGSIDQFARTVAPVVTAGQRRVGALTDAYLRRLHTLTTGEQIAAPTVSLDLLTDLQIRGVPALEVYQRGGPTVWTALDAGKSLAEAVQMGEQRMTKTAVTDLQLAKTHAAQQSQDARGVKYFRRVLRGAQSCNLCVVASTQRYKRGDLLPIHPGCDCGVEDLPGDADPGQVIDEQLLTQAHQSILDSYGAFDGSARGIPGTEIRYQDVAVAVNDHGELGPVLGVWGQHFTGPNQI